MQYYALEKEMRVLANDAKKGVLYSCPECRSNIRVRSGPHRQPHFYHLRKERNCRQHQKSLTHLQIQNRFSSLIGKDEIVLEKAFPEINRIADVAWENKKIIFEVQCSSISLAEARQRCEDYESLGLIPVWILHDKRYNKRKMSAAEHFLRTRYCFFTNINDQGEGIFYDQKERCQAYRRLHKGAKIPVDFRKPLPSPVQRLVAVAPKKFFLLRFYQIFLRMLLEMEANS